MLEEQGLCQGIALLLLSRGNGKGQGCVPVGLSLVWAQDWLVLAFCLLFSSSFYLAAEEVAPKLGNIHGSPNPLLRYGQIGDALKIGFWGNTPCFWLLGRLFEEGAVAHTLCVGRAAPVDDAFPSLGLLRSGIRAHTHVKIAQGTGLLLWSETLSWGVSGDRSGSASRPARVLRRGFVSL